MSALHAPPKALTSAAQGPSRNLGSIIAAESSRNISRCLRLLCQFCVFAALVASFVPRECPSGGGGGAKWGIFRKPLKRAFRRWMIRGYHWPVPLAIRGFCACSGQVSDTLHRTLSPLPRALGGGGYPPPHLELGNSKNHVSEKGWTVEELYKGNIMNTWGRTSLLMGSYPEW